MPSKLSTILNSQSNSSSTRSSPDENDDDEKNFRKFYRKTNEFLEKPSDFDENQSQSEISDDDDDKLNLPNPSYYLTRQKTLYENDWPRKSSSTDKNHFQTLFNENDMKKRLDKSLNEKGNFENSIREKFSPSKSNLTERSISNSNFALRSTSNSNFLPGSMTNSNFSPRTTKNSDLTSQNATNSKFLERSNSTFSQNETKVIGNLGAFKFFTGDNFHNDDQQMKSSSSKLTTVESFHRSITDDDEDSEISNLKESDLKLKLKQQKRQGKQTGQLLNQLHENYYQLLEKYAQAENTIDQLRFQPKNFDEKTPKAQLNEGKLTFVPVSAANFSTARSSGIFHSTGVTPVSSNFHRISTTSSSTTQRKSTSPENSGTVESVFDDDVQQQKLTVENLTTPETIKLDFLLETKKLCEKMQNFLTLMNENQLSLGEQKQVYENVKDDYYKLLKIVEQRRDSMIDIDLDGDINDELENMKKLLNEIVKRITENLIGKSTNNAESISENQNQQQENHENQISARSSLCNHAELMDQYRKLLETVHKGNERTENQNSTFQNSEEEPREHPKVTYLNLDSTGDEEKYSSRKIRRVQTPISKVPQQTKPKQRTDDLKNYDILMKNLRFVNDDEKSLEELRFDEERPFSASSNPNNRMRSSAGSMRTRTSDYDSGFGTHNTTKLSRDSKLNNSVLDETPYQSLDEEHRQQIRTDSEQDLMSSVSSRSSGSGAPKSSSSKYTKRFNQPSSLKPHQENYRRKPSGHSDEYPSDIETHLTEPFEPTIDKLRKSRDQRYQTISRRSQSTSQLKPKFLEELQLPRRSVSIRRSQTQIESPSSSTESIDSMGRQYHSSFTYYPRSKNSRPIYQSSVIIDQNHADRSTPFVDNTTLERSNRPVQQRLYIDRKTGMIYRYESKARLDSSHAVSSNSGEKFHHCSQCGSVTNYHHRHHIDSSFHRPTTIDHDDPGYESGNKRNNRERRRRHVSSSESENDQNSARHDFNGLTEAFERARKVQHHSHNLSRNIRRQLKLVLTTM